MSESTTNSRSARTAVNYRRGLNRIYLVFCVTWILLFLVGWPMYLRSQRLKNAIEIESTHGALTRELKGRISDPNDLQQIEKADKEIARLQRESASLASIYTEMWKTWSWFESALLVVPPIVLYGVLSGLAMITRWIVRGFKST